VHFTQMTRFRQAAGVILILLALMAAFPGLNPLVQHPVGH
jgi:hypothetical protein